MLLALTVLVVATACIRSDEVGEESPAATQPPGDAGVVATVTTDPGTPSEESIAESPLATWDPSGVDAFHQEGIEPGTLHISASCVLLVLENGGKVLPVWPEPTSWNASTQTIEYVSPLIRGENARLQAGDRIGLGGSTLTGTFSLFVTPPTPDCEAQAVTTFIVSEIQIQTE